MKPDGTASYTEEKAQRVAYLVAGYLRKTLTTKEHDELDEWVTESDANQRLFEELITPTIMQERMKEYDEPDEEAALQKIKSKIDFVSEKKIPPGRNNYLLKIAASLLLLAGLAIAYQLMKKPSRDDKPPISKAGPLQPGGNQATLTLAGGKTINLGEAKNGLINSTTGIDILKTAEGQLSYEKNVSPAATTEQHILTTPKGGQYSITLSDGSRVWLNAASSLKYPAVFNEKERVVELDGEGYFEVNPGPGPHLTSPQGGGTGKTPFIVKLRNGTEVKVTGTHFNINAYSDEAEIKTTLLEGSVLVKCDYLRSDGKTFESMAVPPPGSQAVVKEDGDVRVVENIRTDEVTAWKNGQFKFVNTPTEQIMRQIARWYDATIQYEGKVNFHFNGTISRKEPLKRILELLEGTGNVKFEIDGTRIIVRP